MLTIKNITSIIGYKLQTPKGEYRVDWIYDINGTHYYIMIWSSGKQWQVEIDRRHTYSTTLPLYVIKIGKRKFISGMKQYNSKNDFMKFTIALIETHCFDDKHKTV